jgi:hypothetical protein
MRLYEKTAEGREKSLEHFAVVYRQHNDSTSYRISEADFRYLRGLEFSWSSPRIDGEVRPPKRPGHSPFAIQRNG